MSKLPDPAYLAAALRWNAYEVQIVRGVYMLLDDHGNILYIGQSRNIHWRVACHTMEGRIPFTRTEIAACRRCDMDAVEQYLIRLHEPPYNYTYTKRATRERGPHKNSP